MISIHFLRQTLLGYYPTTKHTTDRIMTEYAGSLNKVHWSEDTFIEILLSYRADNYRIEAKNRHYFPSVHDLISHWRIKNPEMAVDKPSSLPPLSECIEYWVWKYRFNLWAEGKDDAIFYLERDVNALPIDAEAKAELIHRRMEFVADAKPFVSSMMEHLPRCQQKPRYETEAQSKAYDEGQEDKLPARNYTTDELNAVVPDSTVPF